MIRRAGTFYLFSRGAFSWSFGRDSILTAIADRNLHYSYCWSNSHTMSSTGEWAISGLHGSIMMLRLKR